MRILTGLLSLGILFASCGGGKGSSSKTFCDTTCRSDSFKFKGTDRFESVVNISVRDCAPDSISWTHIRQDLVRTIPMSDLTNQEVRLNPSNIKCVIKDTSHVWLSFNDCITGRGFLFKLPFNKANPIGKFKGAVNSFDPKFIVAEDLRAYTDRGSIFVVDVNTGKEAQMTFKKGYDIDFDKIHEVLDSVNITHKRIYVKLLNEGKEVPLEKAIDL
ncbi:MAG TPA: hypothetical protein VHK91_03920 [Flavisolibacter sp.]|jgi:hypothetical protein|nr:hypothetical protein [Flavisolibacter sp.]